MIATRRALDGQATGPADRFVRAIRRERGDGFVVGQTLTDTDGATRIVMDRDPDGRINGRGRYPVDPTAFSADFRMLCSTAPRSKATASTSPAPPSRTT